MEFRAPGQFFDLVPYQWRQEKGQLIVPQKLATGRFWPAKSINFLFGLSLIFKMTVRISTEKCGRTRTWELLSVIGSMYHRYCVNSAKVVKSGT